MKSLTKPVAIFVALAVALLALVLLIQVSADATLILLDVLIVLLLLPLFILSCFAWLYARWPSVRPRRFRLPLAAVSTVVLLVVSWQVAIALLDSGLEGRGYDGIYKDCHKVWATRGLVLDAPVDDHTAGNSIASIALAFERGARGAEVDVFYDPTLARYVVSHNFPYDQKNGELLSLEKLFRSIGGGHFYWLDFKHMRHLDDGAIVDATSRLVEIVDSLGMEKESIYVEGATPFHLAHFHDAGFRTIFDIQPLSDGHFMTPIVVNLYKAIFYFGDFSVLGMNYAYRGEPIYGPMTRQLLGDIPVFIYHIPDDVELLRELSALPEVRVLLDHDHGADRYGISACEGKSNRQD
ncbi:MAG TPA: hypothetical protein VF275_04850 [Gammaproteobacteria bacterium]